MKPPMLLREARKDHVCTLCGRKIPKGSEYWRSAMSDEVDNLPRKEHKNCEDPKIKPKLTVVAKSGLRSPT